MLSNFARQDRQDDTGRLSSLTPIDRFRQEIMPRLPMYQLLAQQAGFWIEFGDKTAWDHNRRTIILNVDDFRGEGFDLSSSMVDYLILHELGHMKELYDDPAGYLDIIDTGKEKYGDAAFRLYNCLMDVYVNSHTGKVAPVYGSRTNPSAEVKSFYRDMAFRQRDFSEIPHAFQLAHYLLNLGMGVGDDVVLSPEVQERIDRGLVDLSGKEISYREFLDLYMRPPAEKQADARWKGHVSQRKQIIDSLIRPDFEEFLESDLAAGRARIVKVPFGVGSCLSPEDLREILKDAQRVKREGKPSQADREFEKACRQAGDEMSFPVAEVNNFIESARRVKSVTHKLAKVWDELTFLHTSVGIKSQGHFVHGSAIDIQRVINNFGSVSQSPDTARVMLRRLPHEQPLEIPRAFNLRLIIDTSGSMSGLQEIVRDMVVALGSSLYVKNQEAALVGSTLKCGLEVLRFSGKGQVVLECTDDVTTKALMSAYPHITMGGGTADHEALMIIDSKITPKEVAEIQSGDRVEIALEITDGDTRNPRRTIQVLEGLERKGVLVGAINISPSGDFMSSLFGNPEQIEKELGGKLGLKTPEVVESLRRLRDMMGTRFEQVWNRNNRKRGLTIEKMDALPDSILSMLRRFIEEKNSTMRQRM